MPDLIRYPGFFGIALKLHFVLRLRGNDVLRVFNRRSNIYALFERDARALNIGAGRLIKGEQVNEQFDNGNAHRSGGRDGRGNTGAIHGPDGPQRRQY